jgi:hypothetical protein
MTREEDWHLPEKYWAERRSNGRTTLWLDDVSVREFAAGIPQKTVEAWADAYATGRTAGEAVGRLVGRSQLAAELRGLLQV